MELITHALALVAGIGIGFAASHYWRKRDPASYDKAAEAIKDAGKKE